MENARDWLSDNNPASNPPLIKDSSGPVDAHSKNFDRGVSVTIRFDQNTTPGDLGWLKAESAEVWWNILTLKTGLGSVETPLDLNVSLAIRRKNGKVGKKKFQSAEYNWPHKVVTKSKKLLDVQKEADRLHQKHGKDYRMTAGFQNLDSMYVALKPNEIASSITLSDEEKAIVLKFSPTIDACHAAGRILISTGVAAKDVRKQQLPAVVAPEGFQAHQAFIAGATPELARTFEPTLVLPTGRFHRATALRVARLPRRGTVHPPAMAFQISDFGLDHLPFLFLQSLGQRAQVL